MLVLGVRATLLLELRVEMPVLRETVLVLRVLVLVLGVRATLLLVLRVEVPVLRVAVALVLRVDALVLRVDALVLRVEVLVLRVEVLALRVEVLALRALELDAARLPATGVAERTEELARTLCVLRISRAFTIPALRRSNERSGCATA